jgi:hypothetical protein
MAAKNLSGRNNEWVLKAREVGDSGEYDFTAALKRSLPSEDYCITPKPRHLAKIYGNYGIVPDLIVTNISTNKSLFVEKKTGSHGGNAHERVYKYLSPPLVKLVQSKMNVPTNPFLFVFSGKTFKKKKYVQEISLLLGHMPDNYFVWDGTQESVDEYANKIKGMLQ